jgi:hypothetical protein
VKKEINQLDEIIKTIYIFDFYDALFDEDEINHLDDNPLLKWDLIKEYKEIPWNYLRLSSNQCVTWDIIVNNISLPWNWKNISKNPNITMEIVNNNNNYPWDFDGLSENINITYNEGK